MKIFKNNLKLIIGIIIGAILAGGIAYGAISASEVGYAKEGTEVKNVEEAINDLYLKTKKISYIGNYSTSNFYVDNSQSVNININNLEVGAKYFLVIGRAATGGANAELTDFGTTFSNAIANKKSNYIYTFVPTNINVTVNMNSISWGSGKGSQTIAWVFKGELE